MTRDFLTDLAERAAKSFAQALIAVLSVQGISGVMDVNWPRALSVAGLTVVLSVLSSVASLKIGNSGTASATDAVVPTTYADAIAKGRNAANLRNGPTV